MRPAMWIVIDVDQTRSVNLSQRAVSERLHSAEILLRECKMEQHWSLAGGITEEKTCFGVSTICGFLLTWVHNKTCSCADSPDSRLTECHQQRTISRTCVHGIG